MSAARHSTASLTVDGKYALIRELGSGACGTVWEAEHLVVEKRVALKLLRPELASDPRLRSRFVAEARAAAKIAHANAVDIYDLGVSSDGNCYLVMELLHGETLAALLEDRGPLSSALACELTLQVLAGLAAAHARGVVHRDLKPENIIVTHPREHRPHVKVLDFGIAAGLDEAAAVDGGGAIFGASAYAPREQARGSSVDARADVYAAGAILFEMLTGQRPFARRSPASIFSRSVAGRTLDVRAYAPNVAAELATVVARALSHDPAERPQSAAELASALLPFAASAAAWVPATTSSPEDSKRWPTRSCAPLPFVAAQAEQLVQIGHFGPDFSSIELGPTSGGTPPAPPVSASLLELPFPTHARAPVNWGVSVSSIPSELPEAGRAASTDVAPTLSEIATRWASIHPPKRAAFRIPAALYATLAGFGTGVALAWMAGLI
jgi:serine/threonine-protein kinase